VLRFAPRRDEQIFRTAFIHSTAILFVVICGACAVLVFYILQPFIHSILWAILVGAFLYPFKSRCTAHTLHYLRRLEANSHLLSYGLAILLPLQIFDKAIESIGPLCIQRWKQIALISIFLPSVQFLQSGIVYRWLTTIGYDYFLIYGPYIHVFDSAWVIVVVLSYLCAVLTAYHTSSAVRRSLKLLVVPIWFSFFVYVSQIFPVAYRAIIVTLGGIATCIGYVTDQNISRK
jgi:hypothetical protein